MKTSIVNIAILFLFAISSNGQSPFAKWRAYESPRNEVSFESPSSVSENFKVFDDLEDDTKEVFISAQYRVSFAGTYLSIFSETKAENEKLNLSDSPIESFKSFVVKNNSRGKPIWFHGLEGVEHSFKDDEDFFHNIIFVETKNRCYSIQSISEKEVDPEAIKFFKSVKIRTIPNVSSKLATNILKSAIADNGIGYSEGARSPVEPSSPIPPQTAQKLPNNVKPLKILSMIKPPYTILARLWQIEGAIRLKVQFNGDGSIGEIQPTTKLPLGLTTNAINSAKQIRFEPAKTGEIPKTVVKTIEYRFIIY
jgi:hypothetical protein